ncbi:antibiotic resistance protein VanZ [Halobacterium sp. DL1]|nr:antibiotic resistance protein VanZ [Halobacterium sp. DL1]
MRSPRWGAVAAAVGLVVVAASLVPGSTGAASALPANADKLLHAGGYAALSFSVAAAMRARTVRTLAVVVLAVAALGGAVELVQPAVGRTLSLLDAAANLVGASVGATIRWLVTARTADSLAD